MFLYSFCANGDLFLFSTLHQAYEQETELHRRARLLAVGERATAEENLHKTENSLKRTRAKFSELLKEMRVVQTNAERAGDKLNEAIMEADAMMRASERVQECQRKYSKQVIANLTIKLKTTRAKANALNSANVKLRNLRASEKKKKDTERSSWPFSRLGPAVQNLIHSSHLDAAKAIEAKDQVEVDSRKAIAALQDAKSCIMRELELTNEKLKSSLAILARPENQPMNWVEKLGKRGTRYDVLIVEMGIQLMSSELSAAQAVYALTVFMMKTYPDLEPGVDYRIPGESTMKEWAESIYEVDIHRQLSI